MGGEDESGCMAGEEGKQQLTVGIHSMSVLVSHTLTLRQRWLRGSRTPHQLLHLGAWSHFLEDLGAIQSLPGPGNACTSLLFSAAVTAQGQGSSRGQLSCLIPGSHQSMPFTPSLFLHFFFFLYNEASRD